jgi:hypothetical protein
MVVAPVKLLREDDRRDCDPSPPITGPPGTMGMANVLRWPIVDVRRFLGNNWWFLGGD